MGFPKPAPQQGSPRRSPRAMRPGGATEADENVAPTRPVPAGNASLLRKKVLGERNDGGGVWGMEVATPPPQPKSAPSQPSLTLTGRGARPYDPKMNYTTPRPQFLRFDPERHRERILRLARAAEEDDCSSTTSGTATSEAAGYSVSSTPESDSEAELDDGNNDEEEEEVVPRGRGWTRRLFLLLVAVACWSCYICCMNPTPFPLHSEDGLDFTRPIGGIYDADFPLLDSLGLRLSGLGPFYMMGPEDELEETSTQIVRVGSEGVVHQYDQRAASRIWTAIALMGLVDMCPSVHLGESTCRIGDESSENVDDLKEHSNPFEQNAEVMTDSFENEARNILWPPIGLTSTQTIDKEGGSSGSVHQEEDSETIEAASDELDLETELWQYEQTAESAKEIWSKVKFPWLATEPHLLQILACFSVAGFLATLFKYYPRSGQIIVPASQEISSKSVKQAPVLVLHQIEQLPVQKQELSGDLEVPIQFPLIKSCPSSQNLLGSFKDPVPLAMPEAISSVSPKDPMVCPENHVQKLQKGDAETMKASHGNSQYHRDNDISKPPVVKLLGELTFGDSSRGKPMRTSNQHVGHVSVQESPESLREVADKMSKDSILQSPVGRARTEVNTSKGEDTTPTPLRRSSRLRNR